MYHDSTLSGGCSWCYNAAIVWFNTYFIEHVAFTNRASPILRYLPNMVVLIQLVQIIHTYYVIIQRNNTQIDWTDTH